MPTLPQNQMMCISMKIKDGNPLQNREPSLPKGLLVVNDLICGKAIG
jgi:hypothetical protein